MTRKLPVGIRLLRGKYQSYVRVHGALKTKVWPLSTELVVMQHWRDAARVHVRDGTYGKATGNTLAVDATRYLELVESMETYDGRKYHVDQWVAVFGDKLRSTIQPLEIRHQLELWRKTGRKKGGALAPATLNLRRTALLALYTTLDGKHMPNPVKAVPPYREVEVPLVLPSHADAQKAIAAIWPVKFRPDIPPLNQARLWALYWTGWPSSILKRVDARHINAERSTVVLHGRRKGGGTKPRELPVTANGLAALLHLKKLGGLGDFDGSNLNHSLRRGCENAGVTPFSVYALRHLFGTTLAQHSKDERGISELMMHADPRQTRRYTRHAASTRALSTLAEAAHAFPDPVQLCATSTPASPGVKQRRKTQKAAKRSA